VATDGYGRTALHWATKHAHGEVVKQLLESVKAYPNTLKAMVVATDVYRQTTLHFAAHMRNWEIAVALLKVGANINDLSNDRRDLLKNHVLDNNYENKQHILQLIEKR
jgi:ankyrin repeat protein